MIASHVSQWYLPTSSAMTIAVTPDMTPVDRSNSPPIISSPTGTAMIPKNAACCVHAASPVCLSQRWLELASVIANRMQTAIAPISAPSSGRLQQPRDAADRDQPLIGLRRRGRQRAPRGCEVALIVVRSFRGVLAAGRGRVPPGGRLVVV